MARFSKPITSTVLPQALTGMLTGARTTFPSGTPGEPTRILRAAAH